MEPSNNIKRRIRKILLIEKMHRQENYCKTIQIEDFSEFHGERVYRRIK